MEKQAEVASESAPRERRGGYRPAQWIECGPLFAWPVRPLAILKWLFGFPGYLWPWATVYGLISWLIWTYLTPSTATLRTLEPGWIGFILGRNVALVILVTGFWHVLLYVRRCQGTDYKYDTRWPSKNNPLFTFNDQVRDNVFWALVSGVPIWTAYEVLMLWGHANGWLPYADWGVSPVYCSLLLLAIPLLHEMHFYFVHRLIHWPPLYRTVHYLHHKNANPGPWSGLAMHPVEHLLYFSGVLLYLLVPAHPLHVLFHLQTAGFLPAQGHSGFERLIIKGRLSLTAADYYHYLHHKFFECNYGADKVPFDRWFGTFHDGSPQADKAMHERIRARRRGP